MAARMPPGGADRVMPVRLERLGAILMGSGRRS